MSKNLRNKKVPCLLLYFLRAGKRFDPAHFCSGGKGGLGGGGPQQVLRPQLKIRKRGRASGPKGSFHKKIEQYGGFLVKVVDIDVLVVLNLR